MSPISSHNISGRYSRVWQKGKPPTRALAYFANREAFPISPGQFSAIEIINNGGTRITQFVSANAELVITNDGDVEFQVVTCQEDGAFRAETVTFGNRATIPKDTWFALQSRGSIEFELAFSTRKANIRYETLS